MFKRKPSLSAQIADMAALANAADAARHALISAESALANVHTQASGFVSRTSAPSGTE